jgi:hypothetical protein
VRVEFDDPGYGSGVDEISEEESPVGTTLAIVSCSIPVITVPSPSDFN